MIAGRIGISGLAVLCSLLVTPAIAQPLVSQSLKQNNSSTLLQRQGELERGDTVLQSDGSLYDDYTFEGRSGQQITIVLESTEFDTYLILLDPSGNKIAENDDNQGTNSALTITLPSNGTYTIIANSYDGSGRGRYALIVTLPSQAAITAQGSSDRNPQGCNAALASARRRINQGRNITITTIDLNLAEEYEGYPVNRPRGYGFRLGGPAAESVMNSSQFLRSISTDLINSCESASLVHFNLDRTDWNVIYGLFEGNRVEGFQCTEAGEIGGRRTPWGYVYCL